jgi:hypothetical protein
MSRHPIYVVFVLLLDPLTHEPKRHYSSCVEGQLTTALEYAVKWSFRDWADNEVSAITNAHPEWADRVFVEEYISKNA